MTTTSAGVATMQFRELAAALRGQLICPERSRVRRGPRGLQRHDRQAPGRDRALPGRRRRHHLYAVRPRARRSRSPSGVAATTLAGLGVGDGALVIDLSLLRSTTVSPENHTVRADAGCTWGDVDHATVAFGMATPSGFIASTGVAGLTLGGGIGYLSRRFGLTVDNLLGRRRGAGRRDVRVGQRDLAPATCSGRCAAGAGTSASSPRSRSAATTSASTARSSAARCCMTSPTPPR